MKVNLKIIKNQDVEGKFTIMKVKIMTMVNRLKIKRMVLKKNVTLTVLISKVNL